MIGRPAFESGYEAHCDAMEREPYEPKRGVKATALYHAEEAGKEAHSKMAYRVRNGHEPLFAYQAFEIYARNMGRLTKQLIVDAFCDSFEDASGGWER